MAQSDFIEQLVQQAGEILNSGRIQQDVESKLRALLQGAFNRLDLVPRDEFEAQLAVLKRTRSRVEALEAQLAELSQTLDGMEKRVAERSDRHD